ncbi:DUF5685 family protein [Porcipelethomonas sp.]|uniref:DUF5685 family protein n=1 Tax=Porcipelethomonas sp. TaxID=2981675 RepID=UPI003EF5FDFF
MFGYIRPFKPYMRFYEFQIYNAFYCGLCKNLGKNYGQIYRLMLSYDFSFLGLLYSGMNNNENKIEMQHCIAHPCSKKPCLCCISDLDYTAAAEVISVYHKICDTIADGNFFESIFFRIIRMFAKPGYKKAKSAYPEMCEKIEYYMSEQSKLEKENCSSIDQACEPTAQIMSVIAQGISDDVEEKKNLSGFGYHLGRYVYIADAYSDLEKDIKKKNYNPLYLNFKEIKSAKKFAEENINMSLNMVSEFYSKMRIPKFKEILDNVVYLGLPNYKLINKKDFKKSLSKTTYI